MTFDDRLKEWSAGDWSGELHADIPRRWPAEWAAWDADRYTLSITRRRELRGSHSHARAISSPMSPRPQATRVAIIAHGFLNRALAGVLLSLTPAETLEIRQSNDTVIRIVEGPAGHAVDHFTGGEGPLSGLPTATTPDESA